jgi:hypothetical protein
MQTRLVESATGLRVWIQISDGDRIRCIHALPGRWPEMVMRRENGEAIESIWRKQSKLDEVEFREALSLAYLKVEAMLSALAEDRAGMKHRPPNEVDRDAAHEHLEQIRRSGTVARHG